MARLHTSPRAAPAAGSLKLQLARADIVRAAIGVFSSQGAESTTVEELLAAAGVARRTFYKYFRNKDDVLVAAYELATRELLTAIAARHEPAEDPLAGLHATLDVYLGFHVDNHRLLRVLIEQSVRSESPLAPLRRRFRSDLSQMLAVSCALTTGRNVDDYVLIGLISAIEGISLELLSQASAPAPADVERARGAMHGLLSAVWKSIPDLLQRLQT